MSSTRGIHVGTKYEIYKITFELAEEGKAILFISSELPENLPFADRVYGMAQGQIACELQGPNFDQERIMKLQASARRPPSNLATIVLPETGDRLGSGNIGSFMAGRAFLKWR